MLTLLSCRSEAAPRQSPPAARPAVELEPPTPPTPAPDVSVRTPAPSLARPLGRSAVLDGEKRRWKAECAVHRACAVSEAIPRCPQGTTARSWHEQAASASRTGATVAVLGRLVVSTNYLQTMQFCGEGACCHRVETPIVLAAPPNELELGHLGCRGDESRLCCDVLADGRAVIASGRLEPNDGPSRSDRPWQLRDVSLCEPAR